MINQQAKESINNLISNYANVRSRLSVVTVNVQNAKSDVYERFVGDIVDEIVVDIQDIVKDGRMIVCQSLLDMWGVGFQSCYLDALLNLRGQTVVCKQLFDIIDMFGFLDLDIENKDLPLYILSNEHICNGASMIHRNDILEKLSEELNTEFILIPSSIHEWLIIPMENMDIDYINQTIEQINVGYLDDYERLSNRAYIWTRERGVQCENN